MAQTGRALKRAFLQMLPFPTRLRVARIWPNLRKSMPEGIALIHEHYLGDVRVHVDTRYKVERIMWSNAFEPALIRLIQRTARPDWIALDVGANVGAVTLALARHIGPSGHVHSFEPGPPNLRRLQANLDLNPALAARVTVHPTGVSDTPGELHWQEERDNPGNAMLGAQGSHTVPVTTLDDFTGEQRLPRLDFIKIDVEGMELNVLRGARRTLRQYRPVLYYETLGRYRSGHGGDNFTLTDQLLTGECQYRLFRLDRQGRLHPVVGGAYADYTVAVPAERNRGA
jgi:FkbM family methyltransferase